MSTLRSAPSVEAPRWDLLATEPLRAAIEYLGMRLMTQDSLPKGDGHPVVIFPGLAAERQSLAPLEKFCNALGYAAYDWGRGVNTGPHSDVDGWIDELAQHVRELTSMHRRRISLIGWSLGGIYAREVAKKLHRQVRQVITLGTPSGDALELNHASWLYRLVNGGGPLLNEALMLRLRTAPPVPTTSIFSRSDGIVGWQACLQDGTRNDLENIEVRGSHCGLGWNSEVLEIIAGRLSQPEGAWKRDARSVTAAQALNAPGDSTRGSLATDQPRHRSASTRASN
jgi:pimeloyl-ACP methyl ester carboxylesterase